MKNQAVHLISDPTGAAASSESRTPIAIIGSSGHARTIIDILQLTGEYNLVGLLDSFKTSEGSLPGYEILGTPSDIPALVSANRFTAAIAGVGDNWARARLVREIRRLMPQFPFVSAIHPSAIVARDARIGAGSVIMAGAIVNPGCEIGEHCIVNTRASLDHNSVMEPYSSLGPGVTTGGTVHIGAYSAVGIGATILQNITIGTHTVIGAGATVFQDVPDYIVAYGTPARTIRPRQPGDRYLGERRDRRGSE